MSDSTNTPSRPKSYTYYHAGPLFTLADLHTNTLLASAIARSSNQRFIPVVPQDLEQRDTHPHSIRDSDIRALLASDLGLFVFDGSELDSGTVVEFMMAKMADLPVVVLRTDFRGGGDQDTTAGADGEGGKADPWNLMCSFWPRTERVLVDSMGGYKAGSKGVEEEVAKLAGGGGARRADQRQIARMAGEVVLEDTARRVVDAFEKVLEQPPIMPSEIREQVWTWLALFPGFRDGMVEGNVKDMLMLSREKAGKGLL